MCLSSYQSVEPQSSFPYLRRLFIPPMVPYILNITDPTEFWYRPALVEKGKHPVPAQMPLKGTKIEINPENGEPYWEQPNMRQQNQYREPQVYYYPPSQQAYYPPAQQVYYPPPQQVYYPLPAQQAYYYPPPQQAHYYPPAQKAPSNHSQLNPEAQEFVPSWIISTPALNQEITPPLQVQIPPTQNDRQEDAQDDSFCNQHLLYVIHEEDEEEEEEEQVEEEEDQAVISMTFFNSSKRFQSTTVLNIDNDDDSEDPNSDDESLNSSVVTVIEVLNNSDNDINPQEEDDDDLSLNAEEIALLEALDADNDSLEDLSLNSDEMTILAALDDSNPGNVTASSSTTTLIEESHDQEDYLNPENEAVCASDTTLMEELNHEDYLNPGNVTASSSTTTLIEESQDQEDYLDSGNVTDISSDTTIMEEPNYEDYFDPGNVTDSSSDTTIIEESNDQEKDFTLRAANETALTGTVAKKNTKIESHLPNSKPLIKPLNGKVAQVLVNKDVIVNGKHESSNRKINDSFERSGQLKERNVEDSRSKVSLTPKINGTIWENQKELIIDKSKLFKILPYVKLHQAKVPWTSPSIKAMTKSVHDVHECWQIEGTEFKKEFRSLLNKLTDANFNILLEKMKSWKLEIDKCKIIIDLLFEQSTKEPNYAPLYARLSYSLINIHTNDDHQLKKSFMDQCIIQINRTVRSLNMQIAIQERLGELRVAFNKTLTIEQQLRRNPGMSLKNDLELMEKEIIKNNKLHNDISQFLNERRWPFNRIDRQERITLESIRKFTVYFNQTKDKFETFNKYMRYLSRGIVHFIGELFLADVVTCGTIMVGLDSLFNPKSIEPLFIERTCDLLTTTGKKIVKLEGKLLDSTIDDLKVVQNGHIRQRDIRVKLDNVLKLYAKWINDLPVPQIEEIKEIKRIKFEIEERLLPSLSDDEDSDTNLSLLEVSDQSSSFEDSIMIIPMTEEEFISIVDATSEVTENLNEKQFLKRLEGYSLDETLLGDAFLHFLKRMKSDRRNLMKCILELLRQEIITPEMVMEAFRNMMAGLPHLLVSVPSVYDYLCEYFHALIKFKIMTKQDIASFCFEPQMTERIFSILNIDSLSKDDFIKEITALCAGERSVESIGSKMNIIKNWVIKDALCEIFCQYLRLDEYERRCLMRAMVKMVRKKVITKRDVIAGLHDMMIAHSGTKDSNTYELIKQYFEELVKVNLMTDADIQSICKTFKVSDQFSSMLPKSGESADQMPGFKHIKTKVEVEIFMLTTNEINPIVKLIEKEKFNETTKFIRDLTEIAMKFFSQEDPKDENSKIKVDVCVKLLRKYVILNSDMNYQFLVLVGIEVYLKANNLMTHANLMKEVVGIYKKGIITFEAIKQWYEFQSPEFKNNTAINQKMVELMFIEIQNSRPY